MAHASGLSREQQRRRIRGQAWPVHIVRVFSDPDANLNRFQIIHGCRADYAIAATFRDGTEIPDSIAGRNVKRRIGGPPNALYQLEYSAHSPVCRPGCRGHAGAPFQQCRLSRLSRCFSDPAGCRFARLSRRDRSHSVKSAGRSGDCCRYGRMESRTGTRNFDCPGRRDILPCRQRPVHGARGLSCGYRGRAVALRDIDQNGSAENLDAFVAVRLLLDTAAPAWFYPAQLNQAQGAGMKTLILAGASALVVCDTVSTLGLPAFG